RPPRRLTGPPGRPRLDDARGGLEPHEVQGAHRLMEPLHFDLIVIGSGPAGEKGAAQAAYFGKAVALIEKETVVGGAAANTGTLPSKTLRETSLVLSGFRNRDLSGVNVSLKHQVTLRDFLVHEQHVTQDERIRIINNLARHHIEMFRGTASFVDAHSVAVRSA